MTASQVNFDAGPTDRLCKQVEREFLSRYSSSPDYIVAAPGRVNLIGEHIDYNDGFVLPMAIERYVVIAASLKKDQTKREAAFYSVDLNQTATLRLADLVAPQSKGWGTYVEGVVAGFLERQVTIPGFDAVVQSNVPLGGGLSSSAALEVASATLLEAITGQHLDPTQKALLCQRAEHRFAGVPCGIMDQFSSVFGKSDELMLLDCRSQGIQAVPFADTSITVLIVNSNVQHELTAGEYAARRAQCETALQTLNCSSWRDVTTDDLLLCRDGLSENEYRRAKHVVHEIGRTTAAARAFKEADWKRVGELMYASHASLRDDYEVSCDELDLLVGLARTIGEPGGVIGSRMTGGGFGGCTVTLVRTESAANVTESLATGYETQTGIRPNCFTSRPAHSAHILRG